MASTTRYYTMDGALSPSLPLKTMDELRQEADVINFCRTIMRAVRRADTLGDPYCYVEGPIPDEAKKDLREIGCDILWRPCEIGRRYGQTAIQWSLGDLKAA